MPEITKLQWRRGTAAQWVTADPVLSSGTPGFETDTGKFKIGDGVTAWTALPYSVAASGAVGATGATGATGPAGASGVPGEVGATGASGAAGSVGATGATGPAGADGVGGGADLSAVAENILPDAGFLRTIGSEALPWNYIYTWNIKAAGWYMYGNGTPYTTQVIPHTGVTANQSLMLPTDTTGVLATEAYVDATGATGATGPAGASGVPGAAAHPNLQTDLPSGVLTLPRLSVVDIGSWTFSSGLLSITYLYPQENRTISNLSAYIRDAGGAATTAKLGLYTVDGSGDLTLVRSTTNDTDFLTSSWTTKTKALDSSYSLVAGNAYAIGYILVTSNAVGSMEGVSGRWDVFSIAPRLTAKLESQTDLPSSITAGTLLSASHAILFHAS